MITISDFDSARRVLSSKTEFGPPAMLEYVTLLERESNIDFSVLKKYLRHFLPFMQGPEHLRLRKLVNRRFTRAEVIKWNPKIAKIIAKRVEQIKTCEQYDLIVDIIDPLYMDLIEQLFGVKIPERKKFISQIEIATNSVERMSSVSQLQKLQNTLAELDELVTKQLKTFTADTLFGEIVQSVENALEQIEIVSVLIVLLIAPRATTESIAHIVVEFSKLDEIKRKKYSSRDWVDEHINDLIRLYASTNILSKEAKTNTAINNCPVTAKSQVLIDIPAVNRDPNVYHEQTEIDKLAGNSLFRKHLTFGAGSHICVGAELAKEIIREFVPAFFDMFPNVRCDHANISFYKAQIATRLKNVNVKFG